MSGGRDPFGGGVRATNDGRGTLLPVAEEGAGAVRGVWGGDGGWIDGRAHDDTIWARGRGDMELDKIGHGGRTTDVPHGLIGQGRPMEMPG